MKIKELIKKSLFRFFSLFPISNTIVFESAPVYADNTRAVFDEMVRRGLHRKYRFIWVYMPGEQIPEDVEYAEFVQRPALGFVAKLRAIHCLCTARALISCNNVLQHHRKGQYAICLMHGAALKHVRNHYEIPKDIDDILSFSTYLKPYEQKNTGADMQKMKVMGFPRNDILLTSQLDVHKHFPDVSFDKLIYWMPTYRQHKSGAVDASSIAMPIIYNEEIAQQINNAAQAAKVLVIVKPHFAQDVSRITMMKLSNLIFINDVFLVEHHISNYALLGKADALLTDYSSVYYDYLLKDCPIGLCWDDYKEFEKREGFIVDMETVLAGGEKIYTAKDLCDFISRLAAGEDACKQQRHEVLKIIHDYQDGCSTQRVVNHIREQLEKIKG